MELLAQIATACAVAAFLAGLWTTAATGSVRNVKILLGILALFFVVVFGIGLVFTRGLLILFLFHLITLIVIPSLFIIVGAACGGLIYLYRHKKPLGKSLGAEEMTDYLPAAEFATQAGIEEERALARIRSSYYRGGLFEGAWYIHKSELVKK